MYESKPWLKFYGGVPESIDYPEVTVFEALKRTGERCPDAVAYDFLDRTAGLDRILEAVDSFYLNRRRSEERDLFGLSPQQGDCLFKVINVSVRDRLGFHLRGARRCRFRHRQHV